MGLNYNISNNTDNLVIDLNGDLDAYTSDDLKTEVIKSLDTPKDIIFDATGLDFIDSTGLGSLISIYNKIKEEEKNITIKNIKSNVKKIFEITELDKVFNIVE
ncbi:STAS domain-containing protein [Miniphocaeibacter halophilus]|uniref:STAS domain-containing protein n=1 Tax=Miniphocaeibacter halophilus TaxID=2931922 RepID=A0AC61N389_9FIRM|nr:STAS domain-containing protein [Miniphocaeibacter halophilus]QQK08906.1 STAS domain-containing protein [Miniphocaeibacter halophilus]